MLENGSYKVKYVLPSGAVVELAPEYRENDWYQKYLDSLVKVNPDVIFFLVAETTDVFEPERVKITYAVLVDDHGSMDEYNTLEEAENVVFCGGGVGVARITEERLWTVSERA